MSPTGFEPTIPATVWSLESKKYDTNHDKSQKKGADAPTRTSNKYENMKSAVYPLLVLQRWLIVVEHVISHPALCASTIYHFICPILTLAYILHGMHLSRNRHAVAKTYRSADHSSWSNWTCGSPTTPSMFVIERNKTSYVFHFRSFKPYCFKFWMHQWFVFYLLTIKMHYFYRYVDDSMLFWVRQSLAHCCWKAQI